MSNTFKGLITGVALSLAVLAVGASAAQGVTSYQGSAYSQDYNSRRYIRNCDREADSISTKAIYDFNATGTSDGNISDQDGANNNCASKNTGATINRHRTCENENWWPDVCGNWAAA